MTEKDPCPLCGALPCDWVDDPHKAEVGLCWTLAKIREVIGVNEKPMMDELPGIIAATITALQAEVERKDAALVAIAECPKPSFLTAFNPEEFMRKTARAALERTKP